MMKRLLSALLLVLAFSTIATAQKERNYIYIFDCTSSMLGVKPNKLQDEHFAQDNLYNKTKAWLKKDIENIPTKSTATITIVPFHQEPAKAITFIRKDFNWKSINEALDTWVKSSHSTGICNAWDKAMLYLDPDKDNYFFLLTDGAENVDPGRCDAVEKRIRNWCGSTTRNSYAYYVALSEEALATCPNLKTAADGCNRVKMINGEHLGPFGEFTTNEISVTSRDMKDKAVSFSGEGEYAVSIESNDPCFDVSAVDGRIANGRITFHFTEKKHPADSVYNFEFTVKSDNSSLQIINPIFTVTVDNRRPRSLYIASEEIDAGKTSSYPAFLFSRAKHPDTRTFSLNTKWNDAEGAYMTMTIGCDKIKPKDYTVSYNGEPVKNGRFTIRSDDEVSTLAITLADGLKAGKYIFQLNGNGQNLETINDERTTQYDNTVRLKYYVKWNPLAVILAIIGLVLAAALVLWFLMLKLVIYPTFRVGRYQVSSPYFSQKSIKGARMVVFTNSAKRQGSLSRLFTGRIVYECNDFWTSEWRMTPSANRKGCRVSGLSPNYIIDPYSSTLVPQSNYTIQSNTSSGEKCQLSIY